MKIELLEQSLNTKDLVAYYKLWHGLTSTGSVADYTGNGNRGTVTGAVPAYPGFLFDAVNDRINCGSDLSIDNIFLGGGTLAAWLRPTGKGESNQGRVFDKSVVNSGQYLHTGNSATSLRFVQKMSGTDGEWTFPFDVTGDVWQHVVLTWNASILPELPTVYVNGVSVIVTKEVQFIGGIGTDGAANFVIGDNNASDSSWDGKIGDVMLFTIEKTAAEAKSIFEITRGEYGV